MTLMCHIGFERTHFLSVIRLMFIVRIILLFTFMPFEKSTPIAKI